jgi:hypothetical protein
MCLVEDNSRKATIKRVLLLEYWSLGLNLAALVSELARSFHETFGSQESVSWKTGSSDCPWIRFTPSRRVLFNSFCVK